MRSHKDGSVKLSGKGQPRKTSHEGLPLQACLLGRGQGTLVLLKFAPMSASRLLGHASLVGNTCLNRLLELQDFSEHLITCSHHSVHFFHT